MMAKKKIEIIEIAAQVYSIRNERVMLDQDLAKLYGVETRVLNQQVKRNINKFDDDFMFQLTKEEFISLKGDKNLRSQNVISSWGGRRYPPYAFTRKGILMLSNVLRSEIADEVSKRIIRVYDRLQVIIYENKDLKKQIEKLEREALADNRVINAVYKIIDKKLLLKS